MEKETDIMHLLVEHPIVLFLVGAVILLVLLLGIILLANRRAERKQKQEINGDKH